MAHQFLLHRQRRSCFVEERPVSVSERMPSDPVTQSNVLSRGRYSVFLNPLRRIWHFAGFQWIGKDEIVRLVEWRLESPMPEDLRQLRSKGISREFT